MTTSTRVVMELKLRDWTLEEHASCFAPDVLQLVLGKALDR